MTAPNAPRWMTYAELGELIGGTPEAGRQRALKLRLRKQRDNEGRVQVWVDPADLVQKRTLRTPVERPLNATVEHPLNAADEVAEVLRETLAHERQEWAAERGRLLDELARQRGMHDELATTVKGQAERLEALTAALVEAHQGRTADAAALASAKAEQNRLADEAAGLKVERDQAATDRNRLAAELAERRSWPLWRRLWSG